MWPICNLGLSSFLWLLLPLLLGLLTAWWAWAGRREDNDYAYAAPAAEPVRPVPAAPAPAPVAAPVAEPVAKPAVAPVAAAAAVAMTAIGIPAAVGDPDDLLQIKGVGPKLNDLLISLGIRRFDQISKWTSGDVAKVDSHLGSFKGRIDRDSWIEQAGLLARGAIAEFEAKFGKLDSENQ
jgi:predicted flap endonuclease-1-like 5' DNA nuclease